MNPQRRPDANEFAEYYAHYIGKVPSDDFLSVLESSTNTTVELLRSLNDEQWSYAYAAGKWTVKEMILHIIDTERIFAYRALRVARRDATALPGFDQDDYVPTSMANSRSGDSIIAEYQAVRAATIELFKGMDETSYSFIGQASNFPVSPLSLGFITAGHEIHHIQILNERYLEKAAV